MDIIDSRVSWVSSNKGSARIAHKETVLFMLLNSWLDGAATQVSRIQVDQRMTTRMLERHRTGTGNTWSTYQQKMFLDIHFFLIAVANISKLLEGLKKIKSREPDFVYICKKYDKDLSRLRHIFRNLLEHVSEGAVDGHDKKKRPLKNPGDMGNLLGDNFTLFGEKFNLPSAYAMLEDLSNDLRQWSNEEVKKTYRD